MGDMTEDELRNKKLWFLWFAKLAKNEKVTKILFSANEGATGTDDAHKGTWYILIRQTWQEISIGIRYRYEDSERSLLN